MLERQDIISNQINGPSDSETNLRRGLEANASRPGDDLPSCEARRAERGDGSKLAQELELTDDFIGTDGGSRAVQADVDGVADESNTAIAQSELPAPDMPAGE